MVVVARVCFLSQSLMMVEESVDFEAYIRAQDAKNTVYGNVTAANAFKLFFVSKGECRES